jgi:hypothetical protein
MKQSTKLSLQKNRASPETVGRFFCVNIFLSYRKALPLSYKTQHHETVIKIIPCHLN